MSYIIMCKNKIAKHPYVISDLKIKLYTLEEVCFYIYQNMLLCSEEIMKDSFIRWFEEELELAQLSEKLDEVIKREPKAERVAYFILEYADFFKRSEINEICSCIRKSGEFSLWTRRKMRADLSFEKGNLKDAIRDYEEMLVNKEGHSNEEIHDVFYNIGCCYAGLMYYDIAENWFNHALSLADDTTDDKMAILTCKKMSMSEEDYKVFLSQNVEYQRINSQLDNNWTEAESLWEKDDETQKMMPIWEGKQGRNSEYYDTVEQIVATWKK